LTGLHKERRTMIRRVVTTAGLAFAVIVAIASPSFAASKPTFDKQLNQLPGCVKYDVDAGGLKADAIVCNNPSAGPGYDVTLTDDACDNLGLTFHTWKADGTQITLATNGCRQNGNKPVEKAYTKSSLGPPHNWWLEWNGTNSAAFSFPAPPSTAAGAPREQEVIVQRS
jgi:hypothetical protein